jgi:hypothetical protein
MRAVMRPFRAQRRVRRLLTQTVALAVANAGGQQSARAGGYAAVSLVCTCTSGIRSWSLSFAVTRYAEHVSGHTCTVHPPYISIGVVRHCSYTNDVTVAAQDASVVCAAAHYCQAYRLSTPLKARVSCCGRISSGVRRASLHTYTHRR